jgi:hypothetical protein
MKFEMKIAIRDAFASGYEAGGAGKLEYIKALREGRELSEEFYFRTDAELLDGLLHVLEPLAKEQDQDQDEDEVLLEDLPADLTGREGR